MNELFLKRMQDMLQYEYPAYIESLSSPLRKGLRINTLKISTEDFLSCTDYKLSKSPFAKNGYYLEAHKGIGYTVEHQSGFFYLQEPSASSAVTVLDPRPGMKVLDMCAAPGSKSTQIAEMLKQDGLLVSNEIHPNRARILEDNIERCGSANTIVINSDPKTVAKAFPFFFDMVLCDAPCSGEGMFRKEEQALTEWSLKNVQACAIRQQGILEEAYRCLKPGGTLVYSTCTFAIEENELCIKEFIQNHEDMHLVPIDVDFGRSGFDVGYHTEYTRRIFPMDGGEGHFIAKLIKDGNQESTVKLMASQPMPKEAKNFLDEMLVQQYPYYFVNNNKVYGGTQPFYSCGKCHLLRHQVLLGEMEKNRFVPSHGFFMSAYTKFKNQLELNQEDMNRYIHGEQLNIACPKGWYALSYHGVMIGGAKSDGSALKNKYPKNLRLR
ncbi:MAG: RsmF rRNA methyltransferase first C-terminal domain-containing protein [Erysipelotrichaceae bacterium]|nr:RsmF rRNA methyltransferase first C-terminal domain-containing protein [Erysipelotrichaceae bacterium]MDY6034763.1 RsmF rRNA methyltransferase first C-terminal domain-containing protein [Bulleidia sp.]